jgi:hypothetical protein
MKDAGHPIDPMLGGQIEAAAADIRTRVGGYRGDVFKREAELVLDWWMHDNAKNKYPNLRLVALAVFGTFPSSAESERQFSTAGKDATAARSRLKPAFLRILSYIALNSPRLREITKSDDLVKQIPVLAPKDRSSVVAEIEGMFVESDGKD